ncbi:MAG: hypothetical protein H6559_11275 [Lewinellaceae bacterium]|nr:hypothetical protein [Lewinellaceae bacterium]
MKNRTHSVIHHALAAAAMVLMPFQLLFGQENFIYEAFAQAWLHPESFDEYVAEHRQEFSDDLNTCAVQIRDYFNVVYDRDAQRKALCPEESLWHANTYISYLHSNPGVGTGIMIADMNRVASGRDTWAETVSGKATLWLQDKMRQEVFSFKQMNYLKLEAAYGTDVADQYMAGKWQQVLEPLKHYLKDMEVHLRCYYY